MQTDGVSNRFETRMFRKLTGNNLNLKQYERVVEVISWQAAFFYRRQQITGSTQPIEPLSVEPLELFGHYWWPFVT